jgi:hypothetical protein
LLLVTYRPLSSMGSLPRHKTAGLSLTSPCSNSMVIIFQFVSLLRRQITFSSPSSLTLLHQSSPCHSSPSRCSPNLLRCARHPLLLLSTPSIPAELDCLVTSMTEAINACMRESLVPAPSTDALFRSETTS